MIEIEIQAELSKLSKAMMQKGIKTPSAELTIRADSPCRVTLWCDYQSRQFDGEYLKVTGKGENATEAIALAAAYIDALPDPATAGIRRYMAKVADALDVAREENIADEYVMPLRTVKSAMTSNLLEVLE